MQSQRPTGKWGSKALITPDATKPFPSRCYRFYSPGIFKLGICLSWCRKTRGQAKSDDSPKPIEKGKRPRSLVAIVKDYLVNPIAEFLNISAVWQNLISWLDQDRVWKYWNLYQRVWNHSSCSEILITASCGKSRSVAALTRMPPSRSQQKPRQHTQVLVPKLH